MTLRMVELSDILKADAPVQPRTMYNAQEITSESQMTRRIGVVGWQLLTNAGIVVT
jgi:hypothetical protein